MKPTLLWLVGGPAAISSWTIDFYECLCLCDWNNSLSYNLAPSSRWVYEQARFNTVWIYKYVYMCVLAVVCWWGPKGHKCPLRLWAKACTHYILCKCVVQFFHADRHLGDSYRSYEELHRFLRPCEWKQSEAETDVWTRGNVWWDHLMTQLATLIA